VSDEFFTLRGWSEHAAACPLQQRMADHGFEPGDLQADRRLRPPQLLRRARKAVRLDDDEQRAERIDIEGGRHGKAQN